jgi:L-lysine exporter family protein LysE/ArgO
VLLGSLSARHAGTARLAFALGAMFASCVWFYALGYGARLLAPLFARPVAWQALDIAIGLVMFAIAASLLWQAFG